MRIMSERRFREELERAKSEVYQQERLDKMYHELNQRAVCICGSCTGFVHGGKGRQFTHWMPLPEPPKEEEHGN